MKRFTWFLFVCVTCCHHEDNIQPKSNDMLIGTWDAYHGEYPDGPRDGFQYSVLMLYEDGFVLNNDGTYNSRIRNGLTIEEGFHTVIDKGATWKLKGDTITFIQIGIDRDVDMLHFTITVLEENKLVIKSLGRGPNIEPVMDRKIYLRKAS
jgi:hypothetical protein